MRSLRARWARCWGGPTVVRAPCSPALRFSSELVAEVLLASQRAMQVRTLEAGYSFRHPLLREALEEVLVAAPDQEAAPAATTPERDERLVSDGPGAGPSSHEAVILRARRAEGG